MNGPRALLFGMVCVMGAVLACVVPKDEHCFHQAIDPHAWCAEYTDSERPYCSPCAADHRGCVKTVPSALDCPEFDRGDTAEGTGTGTD